MAALHTAKRSLTRLLTSPNKVAHSLNWNKASGGSILSMSIGRDSIDLAVASHPESENPLYQLPSILVKTAIVNNQKRLCSDVSQELCRTLKEFKVCGLVVSWPVQEEGWVGASCGRVLFTLDQLTQGSSGTGMVNDNYKVCLWDKSHVKLPEDTWGRCPLYTQTSQKFAHYASQEQYQTPSTRAVNVWNDFCQVHWPKLHKQSTTPSFGTEKLQIIDLDWIDFLENTTAFAKAA